MPFDQNLQDGERLRAKGDEALPPFELGVEPEWSEREAPHAAIIRALARAATP
jgi:hypothetical protein